MNTNNLKTSWMIGIAAALSMALVFIDQTAVNVALPSIQNSLQISIGLLHWVINAYLLTLTLFLVLGGKLGDRYGNRNIFVIGVGLFMFGSLFCALSGSGFTLIISRALQGIGGALMLPNSMASVINAFPDNMRGKVMGTLLSFTSIFLVLGPLLGGFLSEYLSWHFIFLINLPICLISIFLMLKYGSRFIHPHKNKIDWFGFGLMATWIFALVFSLMEAPDLGWQSPFILGLLGIALLFFIWFIFHGKKQNAFINLKVFKNKIFSSSLFLYTGLQMVFMLNVFLPIYSQRVLGFSPFVAGLLVIPSVLPVFLLARFSGKLRDTYGPRCPMVIGFSLLLFGNIWLCLAFWTYHIYLIIPGAMFFSAAAPFIFGNANTTALSVVNPQSRGIAAGVTTCCRQLGGTISMAVLGTLITVVTSMSAAHFFHAHTSSFNGIDVQQVSGILSGNEKIMHAIQQASPSVHAMVIKASRYAYMIAVTVAAVLTTLISAVCLFIALRLPRRIHSPNNS